MPALKTVSEIGMAHLRDKMFIKAVTRKQRISRNTAGKAAPPGAREKPKQRKGKQSLRQGRENQCQSQRLGAREYDMDPIRASPCRPAARINAPYQLAGHTIALSEPSHNVARQANVSYTVRVRLLAWWARVVSLKSME